MHRRIIEDRTAFPNSQSDSAAAGTIALDSGVFRESKYARGIWSLSSSGYVVNPARVTGVIPDGAITATAAAIVRD